MSKAILSNRLYVPTEDVSPDMRIGYTHILTYFPNSEDEYTEEVLAFREFDGYVGFHRGDLIKMNQYFGHLDIEDQRSIAPADFGFAFKDGITLYPEQLEVIKKWSRAESGIIRAPTGWGKTVASFGLAMRLKQRTLVLADRVKLLEQWVESAHTLTNVQELERAEGKTLIGMWKREEPFDLITMSTFQGFFSKGGKESLKKYRDHFGLIIAEEADTLPAECVSGVFSQFNSYFRLGISADEERKDRLHVLAYEIVGSVAAEGLIQSWPCEVTFIPTDVVVPTNSYYQMPYGYSRILRYLARHEERNDLICNQIAADVKAGYKCLVLVERREHVTILESELRSLGIDVKGTMGGDVGFDDVKKEASAGDLDVVVATSKLVQRGTDVPRWDCLHLTMPANNRQLTKQRAGRIRRPHPDKHKPALIRDYVDKGHKFVYAAKSTRMSTYNELDFTVATRTGQTADGLSKWMKND